MSQSPEKSAFSKSYTRGWRELSERIRAGASFSGNERNNAFLNLGGKSFADASAALGLDFADDARAVVSCDWNFDGNVDFWTSNRTAPRVRLLSNPASSSGGFLAFRLRGTKVNRDAIGARVILQVKDQPQFQIQTKTVTAGDGFLAQSSRWQHFGLGEKNEAEVRVIWPGGKEESFGSVKAGQFLELKEGAGKAEKWSPPHVLLAETELPKPDPENFKRVLLVGRIPLLKAPGIELSKGRPTLLRIWSKNCPACGRQGLDLGRRQRQLEIERVSLLSIKVDDFLEQSGEVRSDLLEAIEVFRDTFVESKRSLTLPLHLLIDERGDVAAFYQGEVPFQVIQDDIVGLSDQTRRQRSQAVPFPGRWAAEPFQGQFLRYAEAFVKAGMPEKKEAYLGQLRESGKQMVEVNRQLGRDFLRLKEPARARDHLRAALPYKSNDAQLHFNLGLAQTGLKNFEEAVNHFKVSGGIAPDRAETFFRMAYALNASGSSRQALAAYRQALRLRPGWPTAVNNLAWILATHPDDEVRDGTEALRLAQSLMEKKGAENPTALLTLAASFAEVGNFQSAIQVVDRALAIAKRDQVKSASEQLSKIRTDFENEKPIRGR
ncbi:MAG: ASPIC/UnbV domain-containing protein [Akkermansiaceae bacterium]